MSRRTLLEECRRAAPDYAWTQRQGWRPSVVHCGATVSIMLLRPKRRGEPALWGAEAVEMPSDGDHDADGALNTARARGPSLLGAMNDAVAELTARCAQVQP